ncbi:MAG TPA: hypothetical protein VMP01_24335 [Pirellulaceae bacterium]|nr:hypothetical protein [Pirellulaceae bacterium]
MNQRNNHRRGEQKKGVVLLIVVTLLTLFLMIGITLSLLASSYRGASEQIRSAGTYGDLAEREMDLALSQLLFGSSTLNAVSPHNLLADLYGHDSIKGTVQGNPASWNSGQILVVNVNFTTTAEQSPNYYCGRVFTFISGQARGISSRVLAYNVSGGTYSLAIEVPESDLPVAVNVNNGDEFIINGGPFNGTGAGYVNFDINGNPSYNLDATANFNNLSTATSPLPLPVALMPNYYGYPQGAVTTAIDLGGLDENYDAPDYQNMFLAMIPPSLGQGTGQNNRGEIVLLPSFHRPDLVQMWFNFLMNDPGILGNSTANALHKRQVILNPYGPDGIRGTGDDENNVSFADFSLPQRDALVQLKRSLILRPLKEDHPNFTGGNPAFEPDLLTNTENTINLGTGNAPAPYDVDNDGDGIADSIWIDPGLPIVTSRDGRKYKRLVAYLVQDLDGRINLNAHGSMAPVLIAAAQASQPITGYEFAGQMPGASTVTLPRGLGHGPAEVDFRHIFNNQNNVYQSLFIGNTAAGIPGRYGFDGGNPLAGVPNTDDTLSAAKSIGMPQNHLTTRSSYTSPPDVWGRGAMALDYYGMPLWVDTTGVGSAERVDDPYEMHVDYRRAAADAPFTPAELEQLLRYHDPGATGLYSRLLANPLTRQFLGASSPGSIGADNRLRALLTTMGSHIPAPPVGIPKELRQSFYQNRLQNSQYAAQNWPASTSLIDLYRYRLTVGGAADVELELRKIVPFEIRHGQLLNINREFGNGVHDGTTTVNGATLPLPEDIYGVVDDPGESYRNLDPMNGPNYEPREKIWPGTGPGSWLFSFEHENDLRGPIPLVPGYPPYDPGAMPPQYVAYPDVRQIMARHLYCLGMLLRDQTQELDTDGDGMPNTPQETARMIAQWAVNAVDFRDADSICTGFEYDENPWNGWDVDGRLDTADVDLSGNPVPRGVVWGIERPELLITEAFAAHGRRTEDLTNETADPGETAADVAGGDDDFDQRLVPHGSLFIELYNPWFDRGNNNYDHKARELYSQIGGGVELHRINAQGSPVWRMLIVKGALLAGGQQGDPDFPVPENWTANPPANEDVERSVYFILPGTAPAFPTAGHGTPYFLPASIDPMASGAPQLTTVRPGKYAVIGGYDDEQMGTPPRYITYFGRRTDAIEGGALNLNMTRRIELWPELNSTNPQVYVYDNSAPGANDLNFANMQPPVAIPIENLSVSVPTGTLNDPAYPPTTNVTLDGEPIYDPPLDTPLDTAAALQQNITTPQYRRIFLQRLANPLLAWNPVTNPYITIDASDISMTAYNGVAVDTADPNIGMGNRNFQTFQRGGPFPDTEVPGYAGYNLAASRGYRNLWTQQGFYGASTADSPNGDPGGTGPHYFSHQLYHTLGYLNRRFWGPPGNPYFTAMSGVPQGYVGAPTETDGEDMQPRGFPWLTHLDRPLTSPMELLNVSSQSSSQLLQRFRMQIPATQPLTTAYNNANTSDPYGHLLNFFQTTTDATTNDAPNLCRIFDYLEVPSPYIGAERYYNPQTFQTDPTDTQRIQTFRPPFNKASRFRDPGRININTIYDSAVWEAIAKTVPGMDRTSTTDGQTFFNNLLQSRQGYPGAALAANPAYPSLFSQPFRSADSADMMPPIPPPITLRQSAAHGSLLRATTPGVATSPPLFTAPFINAPQAWGMQAHEDVGRNPYFRFQGLQKVANMVTTRSNVYAVWITVGYFEVEENRPAAGGAIVVDAAHPDGYRLGQEIGADSGGIKRHRSFFIIDRSIPVAYEPGKRHNTDKAVLLRRYIE